MEPTTQPVTKKMDGRKKLGLWFVIGPTALTIAGFLLYAIANTLVRATAPAGDGLFGETGDISIILNVLLFLVGALGMALWLPLMIVGIIFLATPTQSAEMQKRSDIETK